jgi:hypothetical protein
MKYIALILLAAFGIVACSSGPAMITVHGTVREYDDPATGFIPAAQKGARVTITDPLGKVIAVSSLHGDAMHSPADTLTFEFTVKVPQGLPLYGISVKGLNGMAHYTQQQMQRGPALCTGKACPITIVGYQHGVMVGARA